MKLLADDGWYLARTRGSHRQSAVARPSRVHEYPEDSDAGPLWLTRVPQDYAGIRVSANMYPAIGLLHYVYLRPVLQLLPLEAGWRRSLYMIWSWKGPKPEYPFPLDIRVVGREAQTVPAGTYDCWKVELRIPSSRAKTNVWISRDRHWVVRVQEPIHDGAQEEVLASVTPPAP